MGHRLLAFALLAGISVWAPSQKCPQVNETGLDQPSEPRTLEGQLVFHDGIRKWFELKMDESQCGQVSIQLVRGGREWSPLEVLRGCRVRSKGEVGSSPTGYYSLELYQDVQSIEPVGKCVQQLPLSNQPKGKPDRAVRSYRVEMHVDYRPGDHPIAFRVTTAGKELQPWQAYASYDLTGGFVLYGHCGEGFVVDKVFGTPEASPSHFTESRDSGDMAMFDPESAASSGTRNLQLGYTCVRHP